ncbi:hypothetical protein S1OALGB6SA_2031 [Olavius algarvensis spirochete endosymbiont]|uniref:hypothetical protein n=1 Tax=Olavius algarvensis spirochete endosymbiont TaxID=260710 RepID=UPI000F29D615|nr:hypothetical protein [Olavius algarvensis spirochete endosymbiont]VDB00939.1 hypothetical protein S1OALGB6SA_2031 [Olavius algarvensis spirochete endosymbiont]
MSELISPESRVFHIGHECYIVYLGNQVDDIKPFLRIGSTKDIPDEVLEVLSTTVITDNLVGNPLLEILLAPRFKGRYLGDTGTANKISRFFDSFDLPTDDIIDYHKVEDGERRHMVWFYSSGNIHLRYGDRIIFDLNKRAKEDRHFVYLYEEAKHEFLKNPLRYVRRNFTGRGIYLADGNCFWYEKGDFISFTPHPGIVAKMMSDGVDPDFITTIAYNLKEDELDSQDAEAFIDIVKRIRMRRKQLRVITTYPSVQRKLKLLFPERRNSSPTLVVADVSGKHKTTFHNSIINRSGDKLLIKNSDLPNIAFDWEIEDGLSVDIEQGLIKYRSRELSESFSILKGFPIEFRDRSAVPSQLSNKHISLMLSNIEGSLSDEKYQVLKNLESYLKTLSRDITEDSSISSLLKQDSGRARDGLRRFSKRDGGSAWFFLSNCYSILNLLIAQLGEENELSGNAKQVADAIWRLTSRLPTPSPLLPFWGELYLGEQPALLWFATKKAFVATDIETARESAEHIVEAVSLDESPWHEELARLLALIRSLRQRDEGPLTEKQLVHLKQAGEEAAKKKKEESRGFDDPTIPKRHDGLEASPLASMTRKTAGAPNTSRRKWPWILLACTIFLFGGALLWDYTERAPWDSIIQKYDIGEKDAVKDLVDADVQSDSIESPRDFGDPMDDAVIDSPADEVDIDVAPRTAEEIEAYLNLKNRAIITEVDIHLAANEIAVLNGFRDLDYKVFEGADPDWILPGNTLVLPGGGVYAIRSGDTIWFLAAREVRSDAEKRMEIFDSSVSILEAGDSDFESRTAALANLREVSENAKAAQVRGLAKEVLLSLRK